MPSSFGLRSLRFRYELFDESDDTHKRELSRASAAFADVSEAQCPRALQGEAVRLRTRNLSGSMMVLDLDQTILK